MVLVLVLHHSLRGLTVGQVQIFEVIDQLVPIDHDLINLARQARMHTRALERVLEHPEELLEEATRARCCALVQECLFQTLQVLPLQLERFFEAIVVLQRHAAAQVVMTHARVGNLDRLRPSLAPVLR